MGLGGISIWQLLIVLAILILLFGSSRLRGLGGDLGTAIKGFKDSMKEDDQKSLEEPENQQESYKENAEEKRD